MAVPIFPIPFSAAPIEEFELTTGCGADAPVTESYTFFIAEIMPKPDSDSFEAAPEGFWDMLDPTCAIGEAAAAKVSFSALAIVWSPPLP